MKNKMTKETKELKKVEVDNSVNAFITKAIESNAPVETMERLFSLAKEMKSEQANQEFVRSMANLQANLPLIEKKKSVKNKSGQVVYKFAPLDDIVRQIKDVIANNDFSYRFREEVTEKTITAVCIITHVSGHKEESSFTVDIGTELYMTDTQKRGARMTFAKRYAFCNGFGIITGDEDIDATDEKGAKPASDKAKIAFYIQELGYRITGEELVNKIKELTGLDPKTAKNIPDILNRLEIKVAEKKEADENEDITIQQ